MKYYSEVLKKTFDSEDECLKAEEDYRVKTEEAEKKKAELSNARKARAKEVSDARVEMQNAKQKYTDLLIAFIKDYGSYHMTFSNGDKTEAIDYLFRLF